MRDFTARSWGGSWALLALILPNCFAFVVSFDFSSIFSRFWRGFGRVLGGQNGPKSIFWVFWGGFFSIPYFRSIFASFLRKSMRKNIWNFACFSIGCFSICLPKSLFSIMLESLKLAIFSWGNHYFYKISIFAINVRRCRKWVKKQWVGWAKRPQKSMKLSC